MYLRAFQPIVTMVYVHLLHLFCSYCGLDHGFKIVVFAGIWAVSFYILYLISHSMELSLPL